MQAVKNSSGNMRGAEAFRRQASRGLRPSLIRPRPKPDASLANPQALRDVRLMGLAIHLLGVPREERDGHALPAPRGHKVWRLLAYLIRSKVGVSRTHLAGLLVEDADDAPAALPSNLSRSS